MNPSAIRLLLFTGIIQCIHGLKGPNVCFEQQNYVLTTRVKFQQPVIIRTYSWCARFPPRCSNIHTEMREKWKVQTVQQAKTVEVCCEGFEEEEDMCLPKCPEGFTGDNCDKGCPLDRWGQSCGRECRCPENSQCDAKNGKCICLDGWIGSNCSLREDSLQKTTLANYISSVNERTKPLFDWSTHIQISTNNPIFEINNVATKKQLLNNSTTTQYSSSENNSSKQRNVFTEKSTTLPTFTQSPITTPRVVTSRSSSKHTTTRATFKPTTIKSTSSSTLVPHILNTITTEKLPEITTTVIGSTTTISEKNLVLTNKITTTRTQNIKTTMEKYNPISQIESPNMTQTSTDLPVFLMTPNSTRSTTEKTKLYTVPLTTVSTAKRKQSKTHKGESDILNITLHSAASSNDTNSKIFKTVTLPTINNTTWKALLPKSRQYVESKMITIPVRIIMDSGRSQPSVYSKKSNSSSGGWNDLTTPKSSTSVRRILTHTKNDSSPANLSISKIEPTEETKFVLTEPEQITSVAGSNDADDKREDLFSVLSIAAGASVAIIVTACVVVLIARCRVRQEHTKREKQMEMDQLQSMMNTSEDDLSTGYLSSVYHSPHPDLPRSTRSIDKTRFSVPFMQPVIIHAISPNMIENFRDILECHYDHPKPPRPTSFSIPPHGQSEVTPSLYTNTQLNTLPRISEDANQPCGIAEICLPVTDAVINLLKLEHQNAQHHALNMENVDPVYDEIPCWHPAPICTNQVLTVGDEAVTEL